MENEQKTNRTTDNNACGASKVYRPGNESIFDAVVADNEQ